MNGGTYSPNFTWDLGVVAGAPEVDDRGQIVYPVLTASGTLKMATQGELAKRNPVRG
jgi:hypothetical protein